MSFLLDTDICSAYLKNDQGVVAKLHAALRRLAHVGGHRG